MNRVWLQRRGVWWLLFPVFAAHLAGVMWLVPWVLHASRRWGRSDLLPLFFVIGALASEAVLLWRARRRVPAFAEVALGDETEKTVLRALEELHDLPRLTVRHNLEAWFALSLFVSGALLRWGNETWAVVPYLAFMSLLPALLSGGFTAVLVSERCFSARNALAKGLPPHRVVSVPKPRATPVRALVMTFTLALVLVPVVAGLDVVRTSLLDAPARLRAVPEVQREELAQALRDELQLTLAELFALSLVFAGLVAASAGRSIARPLSQLVDEANRLTRGELLQPRVIAADSEVWRVTSTFAALQERLTGLVARVSRAGSDVSGATSLLARTSRRSETTAAEQAAALNETSATTEELARSARQIAASAASVLELALRTQDAARQGTQDAAAFLAAVERMTQDNVSIESAVRRLQQRVQQIGRIVELINTVADRSDLLALSAELEGTRAGDVGRGFSLVGAEMRRLAENVLESTAEVEGLIAEIRDATVRTAEATQRGSALTETSATLASEVTGALERVAKLAAQTADQVRGITLATQQQKSGTDQLAEAMGDVLSGTQQELAVTQHLAEVNQSLVTLAGSLQTVVARFSAAQGET